MNGTRDPNLDAPAPATNVPPAAAGYVPPQMALPHAQMQPRDSRAKSPALACFLSAMPGLGQIYVGYYQRGFVHAIVVASIIAFLAGQNRGWSPLIPLFALFLAFFWLYNIIDAGRRAALYKTKLIGSEEIELPSDFSMPGLHGSIFGGVLLIGGGFIILLHTRFGVPLEWLEDWWPLAPIFLGVYLVVKAIQERSS